MRGVLFPAGIDVQSRKYCTTEDPRGIPDLFVSILHYYGSVLLHNLICTHVD